MRKIIKYAVIVIALAAVAWAVTSRLGVFKPKGDQGWTAPEWADTLKQPYKPSYESLAMGKTLFNSYCISCHGRSGRGDGAPGMTFQVKPANFHDKAVMSQSDGALFWKLTEGHGDMPAYGQTLSTRERWHLIVYIRQFSKMDDSVITLDHTVPAGDYAINPQWTSPYFPLPAKPSNVVKSDAQAFMVDTVVSGLTMPWSMAFLPDSSVLIAERSGKLLRVKQGILQTSPVGGQVPTGLRDVQLDPGFSSNGYLYLSYYIEPTKKEGGYTVLMRGRLDGSRLTDDTILYKAGPFKEGGFWYGSKIALDQKGHVYLTVGQRTIDDRHRWKTVQDLSNPSGKVIRLNMDGSIPVDNPFVHKAGARPEIYTYGHRQPEGLFYDAHTGQIWEDEHGEMGGCELNLLKPGGNYGWPLVTFSRNYDGTIISKDTARAGMESPVHYWIPSLAPGGMAFVYGDRYPGWDGDLFVGSLVQRMLNRCVMDGNHVLRDERLLEDIGRVREVEFGPDHFLYLMTEDTGLLIRLIPVTKTT